MIQRCVKFPVIKQKNKYSSLFLIDQINIGLCILNLILLPLDNNDSRPKLEMYSDRHN